MTRSAGPLLACALALLSAQANAQAGATPPTAAHHEAGQPAVPVEPQPPAANPPTADDICRTLEQAAAENGVPVEFFARVIWQESRFNGGASVQSFPSTRTVCLKSTVFLISGIVWTWIMFAHAFFDLKPLNLVSGSDSC